MLKKERIDLYLSALRLDRWPRSLAIFFGTTAAVVLDPTLLPQLSQPMVWLQLLTAFLLTWVISTANYIVNEITDAPFDAHHPQKRHRPLVQKQIRRRWLLLLWMAMVAGSALIAWLGFNRMFLSSLAMLLLAGLIYNVPPVRVKDIPYLDSTMESANNPIRFFIGWYVLSPAFPPISLLLAWWLFGNFLMVGKRVAEKKFLSDAESAAYRLSLRKYRLVHLIVFMIANAALFVGCFAWFAWFHQLRLLVYTLPLIAGYLIFFIVKSLNDQHTAEEPEKMFRNPYFALYTLALAALFVLALLLK